jgi:hypothetical protein
VLSFDIGGKHQYRRRKCGKKEIMCAIFRMLQVLKHILRYPWVYRKKRHKNKKWPLKRPKIIKKNEKAPKNKIK